MEINRDRQDIKNIQTRALISDAEQINASMRPRINGREVDEALEAFDGRMDRKVTPHAKGGKTATVAKEFFRFHPKKH